MPHIAVNGTSIFYEVLGSSPYDALAGPLAADGALVVLHHGWTGDGTSWTQCAHALLARMPHLSVVIPDARGAGRHGSGEGSADADFSIAQLAADAAGLIRCLQDEAAAAAAAAAVPPTAERKRVVFAGFSMGGQVGVQLALTAPELLHGLVLVAPAKLDGIRGVPAAFHAEAQRARREQQQSAARREDLLRQMVVLEPRAHDNLVASRGARRALERAAGGALQRALEADQASSLEVHLDCASEAHFSQLWRAMVSFRPEHAHPDGLKALATPTLMVAGAADDILLGNLEDFKALRRTATLHVFSRVGHGIPRQAPTELAHVIADFLHHGVVTGYHLRQEMRLKGLL